MNAEAKDLVLAVLTLANEQGKIVGKTKLLKLLYLADIEHFRLNRATLTGFDWIFYLYGPWSRDYDRLLADLESKGDIECQNYAYNDVEGKFFRAVEHRDLNRLIVAANEFFRIKHSIENWIERPTSELLDYVYFETAPMAGARKSEPLDFSAVPEGAPVLYHRTKSTSDDKSKRRLKYELAKRAALILEQSAAQQRRFKPAEYSPEILASLEALNEPEAD
jgi:hypothetical protein